MPVRLSGGRGRGSGGRSGGPRGGAQGKSYPNRSDLNGPAPMSAAPGQAYGAAGAQLAAQRAIPMGTPQLPPPGAAPAAGGAPPQQAPPGLASGTPAPGSLGDLLGPSTDPSEHVMSGAALGPGPGPAAFGMGQQASTAADVAKLARALPALEVIANRPGATDATRQLVRAIKAQVSFAPDTGTHL